MKQFTYSLSYLAKRERLLCSDGRKFNSFIEQDVTHSHIYAFSTVDCVPESNRAPELIRKVTSCRFIEVECSAMLIAGRICVTLPQDVFQTVN